MGFDDSVPRVPRNAASVVIDRLIDSFQGIISWYRCAWLISYAIEISLPTISSPPLWTRSLLFHSLLPVLILSRRLHWIYSPGLIRAVTDQSKFYSVAVTSLHFHIQVAPSWMTLQHWILRWSKMSVWIAETQIIHVQVWYSLFAQK